jgi:hypothetical protein
MELLDSMQINLSKQLSHKNKNRKRKKKEPESPTLQEIYN